MRRLATHLVSAFPRTPARGWASFVVRLSDGRRLRFIRSDRERDNIEIWRCKTRVIVVKL